MTAPGDDALLRDLHESRDRLLATIAGVTEEQFKRRPPVEAVAQAGDWSIAETLAHLLAAEQRACSGLEALLAGQPAPAVAVDEETRTAEARQGRAVPVPQVIHGLLAARRRLERALQADSQGDDRAAPGLPSRRPECVELVRRDVIQHEHEHTAQIEAVKAVLPKRSGLGTHA